MQQQEQPVPCFNQLISDKVTKFSAVVVVVVVFIVVVVVVGVVVVVAVVVVRPVVVYVGKMFLELFMFLLFSLG